MGVDYEQGITKIEKLDELVYEHISKDKRIINIKITPLTEPGENFGSTILKLDLTLDSSTNSTELLSIVAKMIPTDEFFQQLFNIKLTFRLESAFYEIIVPTLQNFQRECGVQNVIDFFPQFYGARMNLVGGDDVDCNAVLLLENLKVSGFENLDRHIGCDLDTTKLILKNLAQFHAVPIALKLRKPDVFNKKVKPYFACFHPPPPPVDVSTEYENCLEVLSERESCCHLIPIVRKSLGHFTLNTDFREPFATIAHRDLWINNFMVKFENGKVVKNKFVDFQMYTYDSPIRDLLFYICTSVQFNILKENLDYLLGYYHEHLVHTLENLGCPTSDFSYDKFMTEVSFYGGYEIGHILYMLVFIVMGRKQVGGSPGRIPKEEILPHAKEMAWWILEEFEQRKWLAVE